MLRRDKSERDVEQGSLGRKVISKSKSPLTRGVPSLSMGMWAMNSLPKLRRLLLLDVVAVASGT